MIYSPFSCSYKTTFRNDAIEEMRVLEDYANANGSPGQLEMWDVPYWRRVYKEKVIKYVPINQLYDIVIKFLST